MIWSSERLGLGRAGVTGPGPGEQQDVIRAVHLDPAVQKADLTTGGDDLSPGKPADSSFGRLSTPNQALPRSLDLTLRAANRHTKPHGGGAGETGDDRLLRPGREDSPLPFRPICVIVDARGGIFQIETASVIRRAGVAGFDDQVTESLVSAEPLAPFAGEGLGRQIVGLSIVTGKQEGADAGQGIPEAVAVLRIGAAGPE